MNEKCKNNSRRLGKEMMMRLRKNYRSLPRLEVVVCYFFVVITPSRMRDSRVSVDGDAARCFLIGQPQSPRARIIYYVSIGLLKWTPTGSFSLPFCFCHDRAAWTSCVMLSGDPVIVFGILSSLLRALFCI